LKVEHHETVQTFREFELAASRAEQAFPGLCFGLQSLCKFDWAMFMEEHRCESEVKEVGYVIDEAVADATVGGSLARIAKSGALAEVAHRFKEEAADDEPKSWCHATAHGCN
jgi:hypothetical protein